MAKQVCILCSAIICIEIEWKNRVCFAEKSQGMFQVSPENLSIYSTYIQNVHLDELNQQVE